jgi:hypothetical protein
MAVVPGLLDLVPEVLEAAVLEPAHAMEGVPQITVSLWRLTDATGWSVGTALAPGADGSQWLFEELDGSPDSYVAFARGYYERTPDLDCVRSVFAGVPLTEASVAGLNDAASWTAVRRQVRGLGFPAEG